MIRNQWYVVLEANEVKPGKVLGVTRMGEKLAFWRGPDGKVTCMTDRCPHLGASLCMGKVRDGGLACPFHGLEFAPDGHCQYLPAYGRNGDIPKNMRVGTYPTYEAFGLVWIYWGEAQATPEPPCFFDTIGPGHSYASFHQHWPVHYSRVIENQLDMAHLPFVHSNTIGKGGRAVVDGPLVRLNGDLLRVWVVNRLDDGTPRRRAEDLPEPSRHASLEFRFPNLWHNWISDDLHITVAFVPVDEENTLMYGCYYQRVVRVPLVRDLFNWMGKIGSIYIANQDRRIVSEQLPKKTELRIGEKPLPSDRAILTYRQQRNRLKEDAATRRDGGA
jgi:phenylpropionate dioxygenase-like ring-hydroxylating dioxygenase large terminal subunit